MKNMLKFLVIVNVLVVFGNILNPAQSFGITIKKEEEISREFMNKALKHYDFIEDTLIVNYVNQIGQKIVSVLPPQPFNYHFYIIKKNVSNAFASPAGHIFLNSGLIESMDSEDELAGILAHEISHVKCRHISDMIEKIDKTEIVTLAGIVAGIFLGVSGAAEIAHALTLGSLAAGNAAILSYSRENEIQADQVGLDYIVQAGYDVKGLLKILKKIRNETWFGPDQIPTYLKTHPATDERISYISSWLENNKSKQKQKKETDPFMFGMVCTRIKALYKDENAALREFKTATSRQPENFMANYGYGLTLARSGNYKDSIKHLKVALGRRALDQFVLQDLGKVYFLTGQYTEALNILESTVNTGPFNPEGYFYLGRTKIELDKISEAANIFEKLIQKKPDYSQAYYYLGEAYHKLEMKGSAHYNLALYYKTKNQYNIALFHLKRALKETTDPDKKNKIQELIKKFDKKAAHDRINPVNRPIKQ